MRGLNRDELAVMEMLDNDIPMDPYTFSQEVTADGLKERGLIVTLEPLLAEVMPGMTDDVTPLGRQIMLIVRGIER